MSQVMDIDVDNTVLQKLAMDAFEMIFEGSTDIARQVFLAINQVKPGNRPSKLGLAMIDFITMPSPENYGNTQQCQWDDTMMFCIQGLVWLQQGRTEEARALLELVQQSGDIASMSLAKDIIKHEIEDE